MLFAVLGVLVMTSEYSSATIRATLAAIPRRPLVLAAKTAVWGPARRGRLAAHPPRARRARPDGRGRSNAGIAASLVLTLGTVEKHVASIFAKLGLPACQTDNRRALAVLRYLGS